MQSRVGISRSSTLQEIISTVTDNQAKRKVEKSNQKHTPLDDIVRYVWELPRGTTLPVNVHLSRDESWTSNQPYPKGHHAINSTHGCRNAGEFAECLRRIAWSGHWRWKIEYRAVTHEGKRAVCRIVTPGVGHEQEAVEQVILDWALE